MTDQKIIPAPPTLSGGSWTLKSYRVRCTSVNDATLPEPPCKSLHAPHHLILVGEVRLPQQRAVPKHAYTCGIHACMSCDYGIVVGVVCSAIIGLSSGVLGILSITTKFSWNNYEIAFLQRSSYTLNNT